MDDEEHLEDSWVGQFKQLEGEYDHFYKGKPKSVDLIFIYVNPQKEVISVKVEPHLLDESSTISKQTLREVVHAHEKCDNMQYRLGALAKYNFTIEPEEVISMDTINGKNYFHSQKYIGDLFFEDTITLFQDINAVFLIYNEKHVRTRLTKCVRFHRPLRKTRKKKP